MPSLTNNTKKAPKISLAVDFGGTKISAARFIGDELVERRQVSTDQRASADEQCDTIIDLIESLVEPGPVASLGVATCGRVDREGHWYPMNMATLREFATFPLRARLERHFGRAVTVMNDGVAAAWGEFVFWAREEMVRSLLYVTVSTGVGGGLVLNGKPLMSAHGLAGHIGFMSSPLAEEPCGSGRFGTLESIASGTAIGRYGSAATDTNLSGRDVYQRYLSNNAAATEVVARSAQAVAKAIADVRSLLDIDIVVVGGGIGLAEGYMALVQHYLDKEPPLYRPQLRRAVLGSDSALFGVVR